MFPLSSALPDSQGTTAQVKHTLSITLAVFLFALLLQLPALIYFAGFNHWRGYNWLFHLIALLLVAICQHRMSLNSLKITLFTFYYSYLTWVLLLWPGLSNTYYYYLLAVVIAGFVFTRAERFSQLIVLGGALFLFSAFSILHYQPQLPFGTLRLSNDLTLAALSLGIYCVLRRQAMGRWRGLRTAHQHSVQTLNQLLPADPELPGKYWQAGITRRYPCVCVLFADLRGYTALNREYGDNQTVTALNNLYSSIDSLTDTYPVEKIKTNGDQYIAVAGLHSDTNTPCCVAMYQFATALHQIITHFSKSQRLNCSVRIGIATGPVTAGMIGKRKPYFDIWGETVNLAAYLEHIATPGSLAVCPHTKCKLPPTIEADRMALSSTKHPETTHYFQLKIRRTTVIPV